MPSPITQTDSEHVQKRTSHGIMLMCIAITVFTCQDVITAHLARNYPVFFFLMIRYWVFVTVATFMAARAKGGLTHSIRSQRPKTQILRALLLIAEMFMFALALRYLKLAELHALFATTPLIVTALSVPFLGEQVGWRRWMAVLAGSIGVLIILRPGLGIFQPSALIGIAVATTYALYTIITKHVSNNDSFVTTYWYTAFCGAVALSVIGPFFWADPNMLDWFWIGVLCISGMVGHFYFIKALEYAPASNLQPLTHLQLVGVTILGFLFFNEVPDMMTVIGAMIIVSSGLYTIWREQIRNAQKYRSRARKVNRSTESRDEINERGCTDDLLDVSDNRG